MKALMIEQATGPSAAVLVDTPEPSPAKGEVCIRLQAASLNHRELWISRGLYPGMRLPTILGADGSGIIESVGEGVGPEGIGAEVVLYPGLNWGSGENVPGETFGLLGMPGPGTIAERICVPAENVFPKPPHLSFLEAAALPVAALTAYRALVVKAALGAGEHVLVTGIGGGVATFAMLFALALRAEVSVTSGSSEKLEKARSLGASHVFDYSDPDWGKKLRSTGGVDVVMDGSPAAAFAAYGRSLRPGARVLIYGSTAGTAFQVSAPDLFLRHASIIGTAMGSPSDFGAMLDFVARHRIVPVIDRIFGLSEAAEAMDYLDRSHGMGKVLVEMRPL